MHRINNFCATAKHFLWIAAPQRTRTSVWKLINNRDGPEYRFYVEARDLKKERFLSILLDARSRVIREEVVSKGILTASLVHPREVFRPAIRHAAASLILSAQPPPE